MDVILLGSIVIIQLQQKSQHLPILYITLHHPVQFLPIDPLSSTFDGLNQVKSPDITAPARFFLQLFFFPPMLQHLLVTIAQFLKNIVQIFFLHGLQKIVFHAILQGLVGILKLPEAAYKDKARCNPCLLCPPHQFQTIHARHLYIGDHNVRMVKQNRPQGLFAIVEYIDQLQTQLFKVDQSPNQLPNPELIIYDQNRHKDLLRIRFCPFARHNTICL